ncbi:Hypothetical predicted protein [Olea europaea subsp. europaea]|uniref:Uncharacterized protein n=1 Tax=Olea europaea subsp. europaea TaxID=158383 RepID=A0A8S0VL32_OLEEU|nr:Hypothetical predicted protein [Olea europaea subsp. europaea]
MDLLPVDEPPGFAFWVIKIGVRMRSVCRNQMIGLGCLCFTREKRWKNIKKETCAHQMSEPGNLDFGAPPVFSSILGHKRLCDPSYEGPDGPLGFG